MTWKEAVYIELLRYEETHEQQQFTLPDFYTFAEDRLARKYPENDHIRAKIRQTLQRLRDDGEIEFINDQGTYRFLEPDESFVEEYALEATTLEERTFETSQYEAPQSVRIEAMQRFDKACVLTGIDHVGLLDAAHILSRSEYPEYGRKSENVLVLNKLHHTAFDKELFTLDSEYRVRVKPDMTTKSPVLQDILLEKDDQQVSFPNGATIDNGFLKTRNEQLAWL